MASGTGLGAAVNPSGAVARIRGPWGTSPGRVEQVHAAASWPAAALAGRFHGPPPRRTVIQARGVRTRPSVQVGGRAGRVLTVSAADVAAVRASVASTRRPSSRTTWTRASRAGVPSRAGSGAGGTGLRLEHRPDLDVGGAGQLGRGGHGASQLLGIGAHLPPRDADTGSGVPGRHLSVSQLCG